MNQGRLVLHLRATFALALAFMATFAAPGHATMTEIKGGPGGGSYNLSCPAGQFLVGFNARTGAWVDAVGIICAPFTGGNRVGDINRDPRMTGGKGGGPQEAYCPPGEPVTGIGLAFTRGNGLDRQFVNTIDVFCPSTDMNQVTKRCIATGEGCGFIPPKRAGDIVTRVFDYKYDQLMCPPEERATGIQGASGSAVDSMGLICGPMKASAPAPAPAPVSGFSSSFEPGINLPGSDYRNVAMNDNYPSTCRDLCQKEDRCKSWTWVKAGLQGKKPMCWLKTAVPGALKNADTVSGVKPVGRVIVR